MQKKPKFSINRSLFVKSRTVKITNCYDFDPKELGRGAFGVVYKAKMKYRQGVWRAIKKIPKSAIKNTEQFINQIQILKGLDHPNVIKLYETFQDDRNIYLVTDLCDGGQLFDRLQQQGYFTEDDARQIFRQIAQAINYCHSKNIAHRDLKPQNFLFLNKRSKNIKLIDFGLAFRFRDNMKEQLKKRKQTKLVGTSYYIAPEVIFGQYDQRCDIWSMGVILYILVSGVPPFDGETDKEIIDAVKKQKYTLEIPQMQEVSVILKDMIKRIVAPQSDRLSLQKIFNHPWMRNKLDKLPLKINFSRMANFTKFSRLKKFAATYIASQLPEKDIQKLGNMFKQIDINHDGYLTVQQLQLAIQKQKNSKASLQELNAMLKFIQSDKCGKMNYTEFIASCLQSSVIYQEENLVSVFKLLDKDGNGYVSSQQLKQALMEKGQVVIDASVVQQIIKNCDKNGDGMIDFKEFLGNISQI